MATKADCRNPKNFNFSTKRKRRKKDRGIRRHGEKHFSLDIILINDSLPTVLDDTTPYIPRNFQADLVLEYLKHPDLSYDLR